MKSRRKFIKKIGLVAGALSISPEIISASNSFKQNPLAFQKPLILSTWNHGFAANDKAIEVLKAGGSLLDAMEQGVNVPENDPEVSSVGYGGLPDRDGHVTLDACIMDSNGNCGAVSYLENIKNPISVARKVMEETPHLMLSGKGAYDFAIAQGFKHENLLTESANLAWEKWKKTENYSPKINIENHDTIGMIGIDANGNLAGACTTSGLAWKMNGRVGDSPIIGAGLFVDNEIGAATATGKGEAVIKIAGSAIVVEMMRHGKTPEEACREAVNRIIQKQSDFKSFQVGFLAINKKGEYGAFSIQDGFTYALHTKNLQEMKKAKHFLESKVRTY